MGKITDMALLKECLMDMIINGIKMENGEYRRMDPIDYFLVTSISPQDIYYALKNAGLTLTKREICQLYVFVNKYANLVTMLPDELMPKDIILERIFKEKIIINNELVTNEVKEATLAFMRENEIPLAYVNYYLCLRRLVNSMNKEKMKTL